MQQHGVDIVIDSQSTRPSKIFRFAGGWIMSQSSGRGNRGEWNGRNHPADLKNMNTATSSCQHQ